MILNLQYLRGIAALMVVVFHVTDGAGRLGAVGVPHYATGFAGVDLFFVISGFIIYVTSHSGEPARPGPFLLRRVARIVPLYWLLTGMLALVAIFLPQLVGASVFDLGHTLASFAFLPSEHPTFRVYNPLLVVGWTLNYEMAFYAVFAALLFLPPRLHLAAGLAALGGIVALGLAFQPEGRLAFYSDPIVLEFAAGLLVGHLFLKGARLPVAACLAMIAFGFAGLSLFADDATRAVTAGIPATLIVAGAVFAERARAPFRLPGFKLLGDASYSLYLVHLPALAVFQLVYAWLGFDRTIGLGFLYVLLATLACLAAGIGCYALVERPMSRVFRSKRHRPGPAGEPRPVAASPAVH